MSQGNRWINGNTGLNNTMIPNYVSFSTPTISLSPVAAIPSPNYPMMAYPNFDINTVIQQSVAVFSQFPIPNGYAIPMTPSTVPPSPLSTMLPSTNHIQTQSVNQVNQNTSTAPTDSKQDDNESKYPPSSSQQRQQPKSNKKSKKSKNNSNHHVYTYQPPQAVRVHRNITIPRPFTSEIQHALAMKFDGLKCHLEHKNKNQCECDGIYLWMDMEIAMQFKDNHINGTSKIFILNTNLFCVIQQIQDNDVGKDKKTRRWKMTEQLYTKQQIMKIYNLKENQLPIPVRKSPKFLSYLMQKIAIVSVFKNNEITNIINKTRWSRIKVFSKLNNKHRTISFITPSTLQNYLKTSINTTIKDHLDLIPIILFKDKEYSVHHVVIVKVDKFHVGISLIYDNSSKTVKVTGIHVNKEMIGIQHQWVHLDHVQACNHECLNNFVSHIDHLRIGNVDEDENKIKRLEKRIQTMGSN